MALENEIVPSTAKPTGESLLDEAVASVAHGAAVLESELRELRQQLRDQDIERRRRSQEQARLLAGLQETESKARGLRHTVEQEAVSLIADIEERVQSLRRSSERMKSSARDYHEEVLHALTRWRELGESSGANGSDKPVVADGGPGVAPVPAPPQPAGPPSPVETLSSAPVLRVMHLQAFPVADKEEVTALVRRLGQLPGVAAIRLATVDGDSVTFLVDLETEHLDVSSLVHEGAVVTEADGERMALRLPPN
ncbi:MAG: hypothetical protein ACRDKZ_08635 [Actinomycetota bacterium]